MPGGADHVLWKVELWAGHQGDPGTTVRAWPTKLAEDVSSLLGLEFLNPYFIGPACKAMMSRLFLFLSISPSVTTTYLSPKLSLNFSCIFL